MMFQELLSEKHLLQISSTMQDDFEYIKFNLCATNPIEAHGSSQQKLKHT